MQLMRRVVRQQLVRLMISAAFPIVSGCALLSMHGDGPVWVTIEAQLSQALADSCVLATADEMSTVVERVDTLTESRRFNLVRRIRYTFDRKPERDITLVQTTKKNGDVTIGLEKIVGFGAYSVSGLSHSVPETRIDSTVAVLEVMAGEIFDRCTPSSVRDTVQWIVHRP